MAVGIARWNNDAPPPSRGLAQDVRYDNYRMPAEPWSIHVVRVPRHSRRFELTSRHATGKAIGLTPVTDQTSLPHPSGTPLAAINGGFYQREGPYAGDARGLQIVAGELISTPDGSVGFWMDAVGEPHTANVDSQLGVVWPDGSSTPIGLNESRPPERITLYTPALGFSTHTRGGRELVLGQQGQHPWLPLRPARTYRARVREVRESGNTPILPGTMVLSLGPAVLGTTPRVQPGVELSISTATEPSLRGVRTAISGGPLLVRRGRRLRLRVPDSEAYEFTTMTERHPRSAIGWNDDYFFLVTVDGRHQGVSEGMTLEELAAYLVRLGCEEAMNLDGGGSATLWYDGKVRNYLCDGYERDVANSVVVCRKAEAAPGRTEPMLAPRNPPTP